MNQACANKGGHLQTKYCTSKNIFSTWVTLAPTGALRTHERGWVGSTLHTSSKLRGCKCTEGEQAGPGTPQLSLYRFTTIALASHRDIILHSSQTSVTLLTLSQCSNITYKCNAAHWHSIRDIGVHLGQGAQGPPPRSSRAQWPLTALHPSYGKYSIGTLLGQLLKTMFHTHGNSLAPIPFVISIAEPSSETFLLELVPVLTSSTRIQRYLWVHSFPQGTLLS